MMSGTSTMPRGMASRRRNPYDYLPDEPHLTNLNSSTVVNTASATGTANKPDIMQSVDSSTDTSRNMMNRFSDKINLQKLK